MSKKSSKKAASASKKIKTIVARKGGKAYDNIKEIFNKMTKEQIIEIANTGKVENTNALCFMKGRMDLDCFLSWFEDRMKNSSVQMSHTFDDITRIHTYLVKHDICENWSLYIKEIVEHMFDEILERKVEVSVLNTTLTFRFKQARLLIVLLKASILKTSL
jgi:hypothetical protein